MPAAVSYPGVYIEEAPGGARAITGVATAVTAFVGYTPRGPSNEPVEIFSFADFERAFGGLTLGDALGYAVRDYYQNGGKRAIIVRAALGAGPASATLRTPADAPALTVRALSDGAWGNALRVRIDYQTTNPQALFNLTVDEMVEQAGFLVAARSETHRNLSMARRSPRFATTVVAADSEMIAAEPHPGAAAAASATSESGPIVDPALVQPGRSTVLVSVNYGPPIPVILRPTEASPEVTVDNAAASIEAAVTGALPADEGTFTCQNDGGAIRAEITAPSGAVENQDLSIEFFSGEAAGVLALGAAHGGDETPASAAMRPAPNGTYNLDDDAELDFADPGDIAVTVRDFAAGADVASETLQLWSAPAEKPATLEGARAALQAALAAATHPAIARATVYTAGARFVVAGAGDPGLSLRFADSGGDFASKVGLVGGAVTENLTAYSVGGPAIAGTGQAAGVSGSDGVAPDATTLIGSRAAKTGLYALEDADLFTLLAIPESSDPTVQAAAIAYATERRAFMIVDLPAAATTLDDARAWMTANGQLFSKNAAAYFPRIQAADPLRGGRMASFPNSGVIAGLYARTDGARGVWKAPAGTEALLRGVQGFDYVMSDDENGVLNPLGLNCLRSFPGVGPVAWGARTLDGGDIRASEWKYVPVRRLALFIEESLYRGTQWVVFEPNDEPLWSQVRLSVGSFMEGLFRQGAFQGVTRDQAYLVKCDSETTTQADIDLGIVNIVVGFAPLKPAEFVIIKLQQLAGQSGA